MSAQEEVLTFGDVFQRNVSFVTDRKITQTKSGLSKKFIEEGLEVADAITYRKGLIVQALELADVICVGSSAAYEGGTEPNGLSHIKIIDLQRQLKKSEPRIDDTLFDMAHCISAVSSDLHNKGIVVPEGYHDVVIATVKLATALGINLAVSIKAKMDRNEDKFPRKELLQITGGRPATMEDVVELGKKWSSKKDYSYIPSEAALLL